jgi:hypothetical protein
MAMVALVTRERGKRVGAVLMVRGWRWEVATLAMRWRR